GAGQGDLVVVDDVDAAEEGLHAQAAVEARAAAGGQHVVGAGGVVAQAHGAVGADEDRAGIGDAGGRGGGVGGLDLQVLGAVGVDHREALVEVGDEHDAALLTAQRVVDAVAVPGRGNLPGGLGLDTADGLGIVGDQHARREWIVLGLGDEVRGDIGRIGGGVGEVRDLGG